jgi:hypothetical protein
MIASDRAATRSSERSEKRPLYVGQAHLKAKVPRTKRKYLALLETLISTLKGRHASWPTLVAQGTADRELNLSQVAIQPTMG